MNTAFEDTSRGRKMLRGAMGCMLGLLVSTVVACNTSTLTQPDTPAAATETLVLHKYARGYAPADHGSDNGNNGNGQDNNGNGQGSNSGSGAAASCSDTGTVSTTIGDDGGTLSLGGTTFSIPRHSVANDVRITMVLLPGTASVQFFPEGLVFRSNKQPTLTINTDCIGNPSTSDIVYTDNTGLILETNPSFHTDGHSVSARIAHFSRYAVDW